MKCIVKNCPGIFFKELDKKPMCNDLKAGSYPCYDCSDCLMKKIIEKCEHMQNEFTPDLQNGNYPDKYKFFKSGRADAGKEILSLLEIERINDADIQP